MKQTAILLTVFVLALDAPTTAAPTHLVSQSPAQITEVAPGVFLVDFQRVAFGNVRLNAPAGVSKRITVHFGEALSSGRVNREPPGTVRYARTDVTLKSDRTVIAAPAADARNTEQGTDKHSPAILTPPEWGVVLPFRWAEIEGWPGDLHSEHIHRQAAFSAAWDDEAASFHCSDEMLNRIWDLCHYSIKATTFAGVYVDGDRERIPYEADAYLNQLSHYTTDSDIQMARDTFDWLTKNPTWPTEWAPHMVFMAYADWKHTGDRQWLAARYDALKSKLLLDRVGPEGLVRSSPQQVRGGDIVDWPKGERDGYVFTRVNTVVNSFHLRAVQLMAEMATALGRSNDAAEYAVREQKGAPYFRKSCLTASEGCIATARVPITYHCMGISFRLPSGWCRRSINHESLIGWRNGAWPVPFTRPSTCWKGCSNTARAQAIDLITGPGDRSWRHMVESGTTITWEAWDLKYKPNQDWNHAWGAAPANLLPRYILGVQPLTPGWQQARIRPHLGALSFAEGKVPTPRGPIVVKWTKNPNLRFDLTMPEGVLAQVELPADEAAAAVLADGKPIAAHRQGDCLVLDAPVSGTYVLEVR